MMKYIYLIVYHITILVEANYSIDQPNLKKVP